MSPFTLRGKRSPSSIDAAVATKNTLASDAQSAVPLVDDAETRASVSALAVRSTASVRARSKRLSRLLRLSSMRALRAEERRQQRHDARAAYLALPRVIERHGEALDFLDHHARLGFLGSWVATVVMIGAPVLMIFNDPAFVLATMRRVMDVPESTPLWAVWDLGAAVSLAISVGVTLFIIASVLMASRGLAQLVFRKPYADHAEVAANIRRLPWWGAAIIAALGLGVLAGLMFFLHSIADSRFAGGTVSAFQDEASRQAGALAAWFITLLPAMMLVIDFVGANPSFEHTRRSGRWATDLRLREAWDGFRDDRARRRFRRLKRRADAAQVELREMISDVELRAQHEIVTAVLATGLIPPAAVAQRLGVGADAAAVEEAFGAAATDRPDTLHAGEFTLGPLGPRITAAFEAHQKLRAADAESGSVREVWTAARSEAREHRRRALGQSTGRLHALDSNTDNRAENAD